MTLLAVTKSTVYIQYSIFRMKEVKRKEKKKERRKKGWKKGRKTSIFELFAIVHQEIERPGL